MIVSFVICAQRDVALIGSVKAILGNIKELTYPQGRIEIIFLTPSEHQKGGRRLDGSPLVKIFYFPINTPPSQVIQEGFKKVLGDLIVVADLQARLGRDDLLGITQSFEQVKKLGLFINKNYVVFRAGKKIPNDVECLKCFLIMDSIASGEQIIGNWGVMHKKEIVRQFYRCGNIGLKLKLKLAMKYLQGL